MRCFRYWEESAGTELELTTSLDNESGLLVLTVACTLGFSITHLLVLRLHALSLPCRSCRQYLYGTEVVLLDEEPLPREDQLTLERATFEVSSQIRVKLHDSSGRWV